MHCISHTIRHTYRIFQFLQDSDAFHCLQTCKHLYYNYLPKYHMRKVIDITRLVNHPSFQLNSTRPIPIIETIICKDINHLDAVRINKNQLKVMKNVRIYANVDFTKLPQSLTELDIECLEDKLRPDTKFPAQLKHLGIYAITISQSLNTPCIFPNTLESLIIIWNDEDYAMDEQLRPSILPSSLRHLKTSYLFEKHPIDKNVLPASLENLIFDKDSKFNFSILPGILPQSLQVLHFGYEFNHPIEQDVLPSSLIELDLGGYFNQPIKKDVLPPSLKVLRFSFYCNQPMDKDVLPQSLKELHVGWKFNQPINKDVLPSSLERLIFYDYSAFNYPLHPGVLPQSLKELHLGSKFNQPIEKDVLPPSLKELHLGQCFNQPIEKDVVPPSLITRDLVL